jgi:hypothetical protein
MRRVLALCDFFVFVVTNTLFFPLKRPIHVITLSDPPSVQRRPHLLKVSGSACVL